MIDSREPYPEILRRSQQDAHQYRTGREVIDRVTDRIWVFQNYHVVEIDAEGYNPRINNDASRKAIHQWLHTRSGVAGLDASSKITNTQLPDTIVSSSSTDLTLDPATGRVVIEDVMKINPQTRADLYARSDLEDGMIAIASNGDSTVDTPVYYAGGVWRYFSDNTEVPST